MVHRRTIKAEKKRLQNRLKRKAHKILTNEQKHFDNLLKETTYIATHETVLSASTSYRWIHELIPLMELKIIQPGEVLSETRGEGSLQNPT